MSVDEETSTSAVSRSGDVGSVPEVADFLFHEAELLDERRFDEWLGLFTDDAVYWLPIGSGGDPSRRLSLVYDDRARLRERVERLTKGIAPSQLPPSHTSHLVGNVRVRADGPAQSHVRSRLLLTEYRRGVQSVYAASVEHVLVRQGDGFRIRRKVVRLLDSEAPLGNLSFPF